MRRLDENRDINGHPEDDIKRQRSQYNGDQLYSNLWSGKWSLKDEHKLLSELGAGGGGGNANTSPYYDPHSFAAGAPATDIYDSLQPGLQQQYSTSSLAGTGSLTPLAPISMQDMKLGPGLGLVLEAPGLSPYHTEGSPYTVSGTVPGVGVPGAEDPPPPLSPDPALTVLQPAPGSPPPVGGGAASAGATPVPHEPAALYPTMLPSFTHYVTTGGGGVAGVVGGEYAYTSPYSQYTSSYGGYSYGAGGSLLSTPFYYNQGVVQQQQQQSQGAQAQAGRVELGGELDAKSPLAATRANSGASAASPTGSACMKQCTKQEPSMQASALGTPTAAAAPGLDAQGMLL
ncbi:uncharacterized protein LOC113212089 [Frankliniella occidentalis]|uniref:Uncharacterized protein LOC113212089 n=1 Tax=Frankliniella occidentalis TaxID=133901 RepID=A0A9C6WN86_FRAOC|nr:uncharacterized protein LOC113212089 [Frankliniella occidentalis]